MAEERGIEAILSVEQKEEAKKTTDLIMTMTVEEQSEILAYIHGYRACRAKMLAKITA